MNTDDLPIHAARARVLELLAAGQSCGRGARLVISAPTGTGKSTEVPRWCAEPVLVVEPRRVACRSLAVRVASLEGAELGGGVGYAVRDDLQRGPDTQILFATPGMLLSDLDGFDKFRTVILDEFHERRLDVDLLLALLRRDESRSLIVMSATLDAERVAASFGAQLIQVSARAFPVDVRYLPAGAELPEIQGLEQRIAAALGRAEADPGDVLVFLPGKAEIARVAELVERRGGAFEVFELHGGMSLDRQARVFERSQRRKLVLATNVAETSLTIPGVGVVIDSGLVRRTQYHAGRGFLRLAPIALDSADQRSGRAGRTGPGVSYRLWSPSAILERATPPEIYRESLVPLMLAATGLGVEPASLEFLDPPHAHALEAARAELALLGALDERGRTTSLGQELARLPLDAPLGRLVVEARATPWLDDTLDLVAALATSRQLFRTATDEVRELLGAESSDACALVRAVRLGDARRHGLDAGALNEARQNARRLRRAFGRPALATCQEQPSAEGLAMVALRADPRSAYLPRRRRHELRWSSGGTEIEVGNSSLVAELLRGPELAHPKALVVFETRALGSAGRGKSHRVVATCAQPATLAQLREARVGQERVAQVALNHRGQIVAQVERVHAGRSIGEHDTLPTGELLWDALCELVLAGRILKGVAKLSQQRERQWALAAALKHSSRAGWLQSVELSPPPTYHAWLRQRVEELGVSAADDWKLLAAADLELPALPPEVEAELAKEYPLELKLGGAQYRVEYDLAKRQAILVLKAGHAVKPPPAAYLPRFEGLRVFVEAGGTLHRVR